jgi:hypothetical protein
MNKTTSELLKLPSDRLLSYIVTGSTNEDAFPFFYMHGNPCGYPVMQSLVKKCIQCNIKLISFSRAGYGDSTRNKGRKIVDVVDDVKSLADNIGVKEYFVGGWSGGGESDLRSEESSRHAHLNINRSACIDMCSEITRMQGSSLRGRRGSLRR